MHVQSVTISEIMTFPL